MRLAPPFLLVLALAPLAGCMGENRGVETVHRPIVADGRASVRGCPDWRSQGLDSAAVTDSNFGCAVNANLAAMIADPADLAHGRGAPAEGADTATKAIKAWRSDAAASGSSGSAGAAPTAAAAPKGGS